MIRPIALLTLLLLAGMATAQSDEARPNVLVIVTDDQSPLTLAAYGNTVCRTPTLDALAARGVTLDAAYHMGSYSGAVCTPSRHMIMTGRSVWRIPHNGNPNRDDPALVPAGLLDQTLPAVFNRAGYDTLRTCKRGNSYGAANALFATVHDATRRGGGPENSSVWHGDRAVDFLDARSARRAAGDEPPPFLMYLGFSHPHDPRVGTDELVARYGAVNTDQPPTRVSDDAPPLPIGWLPAHPFGTTHDGVRDETRVPGVLRSRTEATIRNELGREYACIELIDTQIGRVLDRLDALGELDNTYVLFTADHGIAVGRHGLVGKQNLYEHTWRVPFIAAGPGIELGGRAAGNAYLMDLLPTVCALAGVPVPETVDGVSLAPVLRGERDSVRDVLYGVYCGGQRPGMRSVRAGAWKLIRYEDADGTVNETQLFNLDDNPHELLVEHHGAAVVAATGYEPGELEVDLADDPAYAEQRARMEALLLSEMRRLHDPFRFSGQAE